VSHRRRKNFIGHLIVDDVRVTEHADKAEAVDSFFDSLIGSATDMSFSLDLEYLGLPTLDLQHIDGVGVFTEEEVWTALKSMPMDKCPGPDGFSACFFTACWDIIKMDIMIAFNSMSRLDCRGFGAVNGALITLIPKKEGAEKVQDFRPISLIHGFAKLVANVLTNRLALILPHMVGYIRVHSCVEGAFMIIS
jgi:hypothetical protein